MDKAERGTVMQIKLTIPERLKDLRVERHLTLEQLAEATGLSKSALGKYETDEYKDISPYSIIALADFYKVSTDYLLGVTETKNHPNTDLHDLHLSDDMIALLKSGKINNRLLCEMATHKDFQRLMVDMEIFVDRIADMRIKDTNAVTGSYPSAGNEEVQSRRERSVCPHSGAGTDQRGRVFQPCGA